MPSCIVIGCPNSSKKKSEGVIMHAFPYNIDRIKQWLQSIGQDFGNINLFANKIMDKKKSNAYRVCSDHFSHDSYTCKGKTKSLKEDAIPSLQLKDSGSVQNIIWPVMVDSSTSTDPTMFKEDKAVQWPEYEFNTKGELWKVQEDHKYHIQQPPPEKRQTAVSNNSHRSSPANRITTVPTECPQSVPMNCSKSVPFQWPYLPSLNSFPEVPNLSQKHRYDCISVGTEHRRQDYRQEFFNVETESGIIMDPTTSSSKMKNDDTDYIPYCSRNTNKTLESEDIESNLVQERKFIVFESCLDSLLFKVPCGYGGNCTAPIVKLKKHVEGTFISVFGLCFNGHEYPIWNSQPLKGQIAVGNLLTSAAVLFSGSNFHKVQEMCHLMGLQIISHSTHYQYQRKFIFPIIDLHWQLEKQTLRDAFTDTTMCLAGDLQYNRLGYSTKYCTYTFIEVDTKKIIDFEIVPVSEISSPVAIEKHAFAICLDRILEDNYDIKAIATHRHVGIKKIMREKYNQIKHEYDVWYYSKGLKKQLFAASNKRKCSEIAEWITFINNHFWWCCSTSNGDHNVLREKWQSLLFHITDQHQWEHTQVFHSCVHRPLTTREHSLCPWITKDSAAYHELEKVFMAPHLNKDLKHLSQFRHRGEIEMYHRFVQKYCPKRTHIHMDGVEARLKLAVMAHNANVHRRCAQVWCTGKGRDAFGTLGHKVIIPKAKKTWISKPHYEPTTNEHVFHMMTNVLLLCESHNWHT
ncbi:gem-associated protein 6 isoform 2-T2 [Rhinophrynus dorsalis]